MAQDSEKSIGARLLEQKRKGMDPAALEKILAQEEANPSLKAQRERAAEVAWRFEKKKQEIIARRIGAEPPVVDDDLEFMHEPNPPEAHPSFEAAREHSKKAAEIFAAKTLEARERSAEKQRIFEAQREEVKQRQKKGMDHEEGQMLPRGDVKKTKWTDKSKTGGKSPDPGLSH